LPNDLPNEDLDPIDMITGNEEDTGQEERY